MLTYPLISVTSHSAVVCDIVSVLGALDAVVLEPFRETAGVRIHLMEGRVASTSDAGGLIAWN
jgi:hypothetical protein